MRPRLAVDTEATEAFSVAATVAIDDGGETVRRSSASHRATVAEVRRHEYVRAEIRYVSCMGYSVRVGGLSVR